MYETNGTNRYGNAFAPLATVLGVILALGIVFITAGESQANSTTQLPCEVQQVDPEYHWVEIDPSQFYYVRKTDTMVMADVTYKPENRVWVASSGQPLGYFMSKEGAKDFTEKALQPTSYRDIPERVRIFGDVYPSDVIIPDVKPRR